MLLSAQANAANIMLDYLTLARAETCIEKSCAAIYRPENHRGGARRINANMAQA